MNQQAIQNAASSALLTRYQELDGQIEAAEQKLAELHQERQLIYNELITDRSMSNGHYDVLGTKYQISLGSGRIKFSTPGYADIDSVVTR